jgi:hypothetical protein
MKNYNSSNIWVLLIFFISFSTLQAQKNDHYIAFYNVENLYDTIPDPSKNDTEFIPSSKHQWDTHKYLKKIKDLAMVMDSMDFPAIIGTCEIENADVLKDWCKAMKPYYLYIHHQSPDYRGIDNGLLYQPEYFRPIADKAIEIKIDIEGKIEPTRDILHVSGVWLPTSDTLDIFVNHWPSRRGGKEASEHRRIAAADTLSRHLNLIWEQRPHAYVIIMGDFNDDPTDIAIQKHLLQAGNKFNQTLEHLGAATFKSGVGSYNYRGTFNLLDQIIVSQSLINPGNSLQINHFEVFQRSFLSFQHERFGMTPNRTYGGPNYYGGISDHYPVRAQIKWSN